MKSTVFKYIGLFLYWLLKAIIFLDLLISLFRFQWLNAVLLGLILLITFIPTILKSQYRLHIPLEFDLFIVSFIFFSLFLGEVHDYYRTIPWWDLWLHFESGFFLGIVGFLLVYILNEQKRIDVHLKAGFVALFAFTFAITIGVFWEFFEFILDSTLGWNTLKSGITDTLGDLLGAALGALIISILGYLWMEKKIKFLVFDHSIKQFIEKNTRLLFNSKK